MNILLERLNSLSKILLTENSEDKIMNIILNEAIELTNSDGGTIYLIKPFNNKKYLFFEEFKSHTLKIKPKFDKIILDNNSIAGKTALNNQLYKINNIKNVINHNKSFDNENSYQTLNMLAIPLINSSNKVIGVLQLVNKKKEQLPLLTENDYQKNIIDFTDDDKHLVFSLSSFISIVLERISLLKEKQQMILSLMHTLIYMLDAKDYTTSGHSMRVADLSCNLAKEINDCNKGVYANVFFNQHEIEEIYYSALFHDIGKIAIRDIILSKENRLNKSELESLQLRAFIIKSFGKDLLNKDELDIVNDFEQTILNINSANMIDENQSLYLKNAKQITVNVKGKDIKLLNDEEYEKLSIPKGNLTKSEINMIKNHVVHSKDILDKVNWPNNFKNIPLIASMHHEKIDGTGYPLGLKGDDILIHGRIIAISDIYDALTSSDRAYKKPHSHESAINIMIKEAENNKIDRDMLDIFIQKKVYKYIQNQNA